MTPDRFAVRRFIRDDCGVTFTVSYALTVAIATLLVAGLVATAGFVLDEQRENAIREELDVVGNDIAITVMATDRMAVTSNATNVTVRRSLPRQAVTEPYTITLEDANDGPRLTLRTESPDVNVQVPFRSRTNITETNITGGPVNVVYIQSNVNKQSSGNLTIEEGRR